MDKIYSEVNMDTDLFLQLDYPFLDFSALEDGYINFNTL